MFRARFLWRLYAGYVVLIVLTTIVVGVFTARQVEEDTRGQIQQSLHSQAVFLRDISLPFFTSPPDSAFQRRVILLGLRSSTRLTVIRFDGVVLADSHENSATMDNHGRRPEVLEAAARGIGIATRFSETVGENFMYLALPADMGSESLGFVRTSIPLTVVRVQIDRMRAVVYAAGAVAALVALLIGFIAARRVTNPLLEMTRVADSIAQGDYDARIKVDRTDEIGRLGHAINTMTDRLRSQIDTITADRAKTVAILSGMVEGVIAIDPDERIVHINSAAGGILGIPSEGSMGKRVWEATRVREVSEALSGAMRDRQVTLGEARLATPKGDQVIQLIASPLWHTNDELGGAIVVLHDVSELRKLEAVRRDFIANISHELKTPLAAIRGLVETMIDDGDMDDETHARFLEKVRWQSRRLTALVSDLLTISKLESEDAKADFSELDLREPVSESIRALLHEAEAKEIALSHEVPDEPVRLEGDAEALRGLVDNLVGNAIKYTPPGGRVGVVLRVEDYSAVLEIEDNGIGIAPTDQGRVFERFYRVDKARSRELGGTGLGLSIVKHVALSHGGNVSLKSELGKGSTFRVQLPLPVSMEDKHLQMK